MKNAVEYLNAHRGGFNAALDLRFVEASDAVVVATVEVGPHLQQPYGIVHGGVYCAIVETLASTGAALSAMPRGQHVVGVENATSFVHAVREGTLTGRATPVTRGRRSQLWQVEIRDDDDRIAATGRVRLLCLHADEKLAGADVPRMPDAGDDG
jgi:uncharacterized protein (TIGR00369 family)